MFISNVILTLHKSIDPLAAARDLILPHICFLYFRLLQTETVYYELNLAQTVCAGRGACSLPLAAVMYLGLSYVQEIVSYYGLCVAAVVVPRGKGAPICGHATGQ